MGIGLLAAVCKLPQQHVGECLDLLGEILRTIERKSPFAARGVEHAFVDIGKPDRGYRKGLYPNFLMREEMDRLKQEETTLEKRREELERRLSILALSHAQEEQARALAARIGKNLESLGFEQRQELLRLLLEAVYYRETAVEILTIIPLQADMHQLHLLPREGAKG